VTTAKVLADTEKIDLIGVSSLAVLARNVVPTSSAIIVPFFDARRGNVFAGAYQWENGELVNKIEDQHLGIDVLLNQLAKLDLDTTAKLLADTEKIDLIGVSSLAVLARNVVPTSSAIIVPFFDARRGNVFAGAYQWENGELVNKIEDQHLGIDVLLNQLAKLD